MKESNNNIAGAPSQIPKPGQPDISSSYQRKKFSIGEKLFAEGDPGGDLYFIEHGIVEIYQEQKNHTTVLSEMKAGEIIGILTCLTNEKRMASARAKTEVLCRIVAQEALLKLLQTLPPWFRVVLKDFTIRLTQSNKLYTEASEKIKKLEKAQISSVYHGGLIASAFAAIAELVAVTTDVGKIVVIEDVLQKLESMLNIRRDEIDRIWQTLMGAGLLKVELEPDKKREITHLENARKLMFFSNFVKDSKTGATKRFERAKFSHKETRVLSALVKYAQRLKLDLNKVCRLPVKEIERSLDRTTGVTWDREALQKGIDLKLIAIEGNKNEEVVVFRPSEMGRTVASIEAMRKLVALDEKTPEKDQKSA